MKGVTFGNLHSFNDLHLIISDKTIGTPPVKKATIDLPGGHGVLDFTEFFEEPKYDNRKLSFDCSVLVPRSQFMDLFSAIQNALHGQRMNISLDEDPAWYYTGRIEVNEWKTDKNIGKLTIDCDCEPFKHRLSSQVVNLCGRNLLDLDAGVMTTEGTWTKTETGYSFTRGTMEGGSFVYWAIPVKKGQQYIFSADYTSSSRLLYVYKDKLYGTLVAKVDSGNAAVFTAEESGIYVFGLYCSSNVTDGEFTNVMLEEGNTAGTFEAYDATAKEVTATFSNTRRLAVPKVYASKEMTVENGHAFATLSPGANVLTDFVFNMGDNALFFKGNGVAVVEWLEGGL